MVMAALTSISSLSQTSLNSECNSNFRDEPFTSHLDRTNETLIDKLAELSRTRSFGNKQHQKKEDDGEIGVFAAEKYFNGAMEPVSPRIMATRKYQHTRREEVDEVPRKIKLHTETPSIRSESSLSWNSQSALLQTFRRNTLQKKETKANGKRFLARLGCQCCDKDSVDVNVHTCAASFERSPCVIQKEYNKSSLNLPHNQISESWIKDETRHQDLAIEVNYKDADCFTLPSSNYVSGNIPIKIQHQVDEEMIARKSIEVFGSPVHEKRNKSLSVDKRLDVLPWKTTPHKEGPNFSAKSGKSYNDNDSDASSDLFEIESLTGKVVPYLARRESDVTSGCLSPNCYAPSEASIEWSVVTASAADCSVISDYEDRRLATTILESPVRKALPTLTSAKTRIGKETPKWHPAISLGCKSQKSINVAGDAYIASNKESFDPQIRKLSEYNTSATSMQAERELTVFDPQIRRVSECSTSELSMQAERKVTGSDSWRGQNADVNCPLPRSDFMHNWQHLYIK